MATANRLCEACVELFDVDGAAISMIVDGTTRGTFGSSGPLSRRLDEYQFTYGEGPCLDAVGGRRPVLVGDLAAVTERRWPTFTGAVLDAGVRAVFALPIAIAATYVGALDLFRIQSAATPTLPAGGASLMVPHAHQWRTVGHTPALRGTSGWTRHGHE